MKEETMVTSIRVPVRLKKIARTCRRSDSELWEIGLTSLLGSVKNNSAIDNLIEMKLKTIEKLTDEIEQLKKLKFVPIQKDWRDE